MSVNAYNKNTEELTEIASKTLVDAVPTAGSTRPVSSGGVYDITTGTLRYLGVKRFSNYYDGDTTISDMMTQLFNEYNTYIKSKNNNYRYVIRQMAADSSIYNATYASSELLSKSNADNYITSMSSDTFNLFILTVSTVNANFVTYNLRNNATTDHKNDKPVSNHSAYIDIDEYEVN